MNKQPKLIDELITDMKSKVAKIARERDETTDADRFMYLDGKESVLRYYITELESGKFSDPIHLPIIKPGDKVRIINTADHRYINQEAIVKEVDPAPPGCAKLEGISRYWLLSSLEVSHD